jgi:hypothetical protein
VKLVESIVKLEELTLSVVSLPADFLLKSLVI